MTAPSPLATPRPWELLAEAYEEEVLPSFEHFAREALRLAAPPSGARVIDVACGPGTLALIAAREGLAVEAIDFAPGMITRLERQVRELGLRGVTTRVGDGQALPYADGAFAGAFSLFGLLFFPDRARGFAELRRVLTPGARAVVSSWQAMERAPALVALFGALQQAVPPSPGPGAPPPALATPDACRAEMGASFAEVEVYPVSSRVEFPSANAFWDSNERTMPSIAVMRLRLGPEAWTDVSRSVRTALERSLGPGPVTLDLNAWLTVGIAR